MDCSLSGSSVHGILQASTLEWVAIPFSRTSSCPRDGTQYYKPGSILGSNDQALNKTDTFPSVMELTELFTEILTSWILNYNNFQQWGEISYLYVIYIYIFKFVFHIRSDQSLSRVWLFVTPWITARQASLSITNSRSSLRLTSIELVMPSSHLILCRPLLLLPPIPPSIRVFSNESTLHMRWFVKDKDKATI